MRLSIHLVVSLVVVLEGGDPDIIVWTSGTWAQRRPQRWAEGLSTSGGAMETDWQHIQPEEEKARTRPYITIQFLKGLQLSCRWTLYKVTEWENSGFKLKKTRLRLDTKKIFIVRMARYRCVAQNCSCSIPGSVEGHVRWDSEQPARCLGWDDL